MKTCILSLLSLLTFASAEEKLPPLKIWERKTPWGTVVERRSYYLKDDKEVEHGIQESFSEDGVIWSRTSFAHGVEDGSQFYFYEGLGTKKEEMSYVAGDEHGAFRTWAPDGSLLFEGTMKNGHEWNGWFALKSSSDSWEIAQWRDGKMIAESKKTVTASSQTWKPGSLPDPKMFIRWHWLLYQTESTYRFKDQMPAYSDVPFLIDCYEKKADGYEVAFDQLTALTRVQFGAPGTQTHEECIAAAAKWREWWKDVGMKLPAEKKERGVRDVEAWNLAKRGRNLPMPDEPQVIPESYELKVNYSSGDYGGVTCEELTIHRSRDEAKLSRSFSTRQNGPVTEQRWLPFTVGDADRVLRALGYLIDQPWLLNDEAEIEKRYWATQKAEPRSESGGQCSDEKLKGRESYFYPYYPNTSYELHDGRGKLWWNADPERWYGANPERFNETHQPVPGAVFPFLAALYPDSAQWVKKSGTPGWTSK